MHPRGWPRPEGPWHRPGAQPPRRHGRCLAGPPHLWRDAPKLSWGRTTEHGAAGAAVLARLWGSNSPNDPRAHNDALPRRSPNARRPGRVTGSTTPALAAPPLALAVTSRWGRPKRPARRSHGGRLTSLRPALTPLWAAAFSTSSQWSTTRFRPRPNFFEDDCKGALAEAKRSRGPLACRLLRAQPSVSEDGGVCREGHEPVGAAKRACTGLAVRSTRRGHEGHRGDPHSFTASP